MVCKRSILLALAALLPLSAQAESLTVKNETKTLSIKPNGFSFSLDSLDRKNFLPSSSGAGVHINGSPVTKTRQDPENPSQFYLETQKKDSASATVHLFKNGIKIQITAKKTPANISIHTRGMGPAFGLGDHGGFLPHADITQTEKTHQLTNDGGRHRWISSFLIFPQTKTAGVIFSRDVMRVRVDRESYNMSANNTSTLTCYHFHGSMAEIYRAYQKVRHQEGFLDVPPKPRLFELGWETWDALGWQTNEKSVKEYLEKFIKNDYPIRWAITGSGFWKKGGTTLSFGQWHPEKFSHHRDLKRWMHQNDIKWMIGQRTNFVALGGPHVPKGKRDKNASMDKILTSPDTAEGLRKNYFYQDKKTSRSSIFPLAPLHILDSNKPNAAEWFTKLYAKWQVDGIKEDTMVGLTDTTLFNRTMVAISNNQGLVMARNGAYSSPGTLLRINDTHGNFSLSLRTPINYLQYAACSAPNPYSDTVGFKSMHKYSDANMRNVWFHAVSPSMAVGKGPWTWPKDKQAHFKKAIDFHYSLVPYIHDAALDSYRTGYPYTMTPLHIAFPDDANTYSLASKKQRQFQWMLGESLMAAPLLHSKVKNKLNIYLPKGKWMDYETGEVFQGPKTLSSYNMPVDKTPIFVGGKGVIILRTKSESALTAQVFPVTQGNSHYTFTHLDGKSTTRISSKNTQWNPQKIKVTDRTSDSIVRHTVHAKTGSITFPIRPDHHYLIEDKS